MGECIAIVSGKGGTGKTSVCAGLATALAEGGERVLCIDCDVGLRNLDISLGLGDMEALSFLEVCSGAYQLQWAAVHPDYPGLSFLTAPLNCRAEEIDRAAFAQMVRSARRYFDYVLIDAPAGVDAGFQLAAVAADRFLLVTGADPGAIRDAGRTGQTLELMGKRNIRLVVNRVKKKMLGSMNKTIDDVMDETGIPLLGLVPEDPNVTFAAAFDHPLLKYKRKTDAGQAYRRIARRVQGLPAPIR